MIPIVRVNSFIHFIDIANSSCVSDNKHVWIVSLVLLLIAVFLWLVSVCLWIAVGGVVGPQKSKNNKLIAKQYSIN